MLSLKLEPSGTKKKQKQKIIILNLSCVFPKRTAVLSSLPKKIKGKIIWSQQCQTILDNIKTLFLTASILKFPDYGLPFAIQTDSSGTAISGCLIQIHEVISLTPLSVTI